MSPHLPTRKTLSLPKLDLSYLEWGSGPPIMLLHGLADHALVWRSLAETLADRYCCIAPDLRGHGDSTNPPETEYSAALIASDLEALASDRGWSQLTVIAHSWAAKAALIWAREEPQRLQQLILVDPYFVNQLPGWLRPTFPFFYKVLPFLKVMGPFASYGQAEVVARSLKQYRGWSDLQQAVFREGLAEQPDGTWISKFAIAARNGVFEDVVSTTGLTTPLTIPTLLVIPEKGLNRSAWQLKPYRTYLTQLQQISVPGNHWPHLVAPEAFNRTIMAFLDNLKGANQVA